MHKQRQTLLLAALFLISGASALLYQVVWTKKLALLFGVTTYAVSTTLSVFMLGLALGSWFFGSAADRAARPARLYVSLEAGIAASAGVSLALLELMNVALGSLGFPSSLSLSFTACRVAGSFLILIVPACLMGGTAPVLAKVLITSGESAGRKLALLYAANTLGGVAGCLLAGFVAIPCLGLKRTLLAGVAGNLAVALLAWAIFSRAEVSAAATPASPVGEAQTPAPASTPGLARAMLAALFLAGLLGLALEVVWTRVLLLYLGPTAQAFAGMLAVYLLGLALGSAAAGRFADKYDCARSFALFQVLTGTVVLAAVFFWLPHWDRTTGRLADWLAAHAPLVRDSHGAGRLAETLVHATLLVFAPTFLMGAAFPFGARFFAAETAALGRRLGSAYMLNTAGCMLGPLLCGFWWLPAFGLQHALLLCALGYLACGALVLAARTPFRLRWTAAGAAALAILAACLWTRPDRVLAFFSERKNTQVRYYQEDVTGSVFVLDSRIGPHSLRQLLVGTTSMMSNSFRGRRYAHLLGDLPTLMHAAPRKALVICLGSGMTAAAVASHPDVESIDCADLSEGVIHAARQFFATENARVLEDPRVRVIVNDGRTHLLATRERYDVIALEPPPPNHAGVSNLYSLEFYQLCRSRLNQGGMLAQWVPYHCLPLAQVRSVVATMQAAFPATTLWELFSGNEYCVIGHQDEGGVPYERVVRRLAVPAVGAPLCTLGVRNAEDLLACFVMGPGRLRDFCGAAPLVTDDQPGLGYDLSAYSFGGHNPKGVGSQLLAAMLETAAYSEDPASFFTFADEDARLAFARRAAPVKQAWLMNERATALTLTSELELGLVLQLARGFEAPVLLDPGNQYYQRVQEGGVYDKALRRLIEFSERRGDDAQARLFAAQLEQLSRARR